KINDKEDTNAEPILKSGLTLKKIKLLKESDIPFVIFDNTNSSTISVDNIILTEKTQLEKLEK
ncbi:1345_t:CDS:2, partial [Cetraspora pellucida]